MPTITPNLWFDDIAVEAAEFYCSVFPRSSVGTTTYYPEGSPGPAGSVMTVDFVLDGQRFTGINGGPHFTFSEAISFVIECQDQAEIDFYWERLTEGGAEQRCGWLKDRYGLSWQVVPVGWEQLQQDPDRERVARATQALFSMTKIDIAAIEAAADGA